MSPWGTAGRPTLHGFVPNRDVAAQLAFVDAETKELGLSLEGEVAKTLAGGALVVRSYSGRDALGRATHAVRAVTDRAIILAIGPLDARDTTRDTATELVPTSVAEDITHDGSPDVVLRSERGKLEVWHLGELGAAPYAIAMRTDPTEIEDVDHDGVLDLIGAVTWPRDDLLGGRLVDVAVFDGTRFTDTAPGARAIAAHALEVLPKPPTETRARLVASLERAWLRVLSGEPTERALGALDHENVPLDLGLVFREHRVRIATLAP